MERKKKKDTLAPKDPALPAVRCTDTPDTNSLGSTSIVPVSQPWILPPDWPPEEWL